MRQATRIYKHSAAGTDWAALMLGAGLGLTLALQATTLRAGQDAAKQFGQFELPGHQVFAVYRHKQSVWSI